MTCHYCKKEIEPGKAYQEHLNSKRRWHIDCFEIVADRLLRLLAKVRY